jgi:DNA-binding response OmpR family regulator
MMATILVVDDELSIRDLLQTVLVRKGHEVVTAQDGQKALLLFRQDRPDVTILDLKLPDIDGINLLRQIHAVNPHHPVIILTGRGTEVDEQQARELGVIEFIQKGFSLHVPATTKPYSFPVFAIPSGFG